MSLEDFEALCLLPFPLLDSQKDSYCPFSEMYGRKPSDKDQPSKGSYSFQVGMSLFCFFSHLFFLSSNSFFLTYFSQNFA